MHGHENAVHAEEGEPEMPFAESFVHHPAEHFGEPEVSPGEDPEERGHGHNEMEMGNNEVGGVQIGVERRLRQIEPADTAADENRNKAQAEQRRSMETHSTAVNRRSKQQGHDGGRMGHYTV